MGSIPSERRHFKADSVCIIGAGPSGLAAAKYLLAEKKAFSRIVIYEQRAETGGLWNYVPLRRNSKEKKVVVEGDGGVDVNVRVPVPVPQTSPDAGFAEAIWGENDEEPKFVSPVYERLETNIPRGLMGFSDLDWKENRQLFPKHEDVLEYLREYGEEVVHLVKFKTQVVDVKLWEEEEGGGEKWVVKTRPVVRQVSSAAAQLVEKEEENEKEEIFDAVICANGHYEVPYIPSVPGISAWNEAYPNTISHSKFYRTPEEFAGRKVIVVGNSASGIDISAQIEPFCSAPLIISQKSESYLNVESSSKKPNQITKPEITSYAPHPNRTITFSDNTTESHIDAILYCTGYFYSYPFLHSLSPPITTSGERVENTYQHMFYTPHPTLSFLVLNQKVIPFPLAEAQSAVIARVLSGRILLPSTQEMRSWERAVEKDMGTGRSFHVLKFPKDGVYMNFLSAWATSVDHRHDQPSSSSSSCSSSSPSSSSSSSSDKDDKDGEVVTGKTPPQWGEKEFRTREKFPHIKSAFNALGEGRHQVRSLEELGVEL